MLILKQSIPIPVDATMSRSSFAGMIRCLIFVLFFASPLTQFAQLPGDPVHKGDGKIEGILVDSITSRPIEYAAVGIADGVTGEIINGSLTDIDGRFSITGLPSGKYEIHVSFIGYLTRVVPGIVLEGDREAYDAGIIILSPESELLEEVRVFGAAALIEARPDKIVYNAERDVTTSGGDASDVLRKVPMLTVDFDGNVSMRGSDNVQILINGRPSAMFKSSVGDALKMMPADQIQSVEVITSPSAKFDGEGTAGIINIITKKKNVEGLAGNVDLTGGTRAHRANTNVNYGRGRFGFNLSAGGHYSIPQDGRTSFLREEFGMTSSLLIQEGISNTSRLGFRGNAGIEYNIDPRNTLNASVSHRRFSHESDNRVMSMYEAAGMLIDQYDRLSAGSSSRAGLDWELDYRHEFPEEGKELSMAIEIEHDDNDAEYRYERLFSFPLDAGSVIESNFNEGNNDEITIEADFVQPLPGEGVFETGLKTELESLQSDFAFATLDTDHNTWQEDPLRSDIFYYDQNIYAGYASITLPLGEAFHLITGVRGELTQLKGDFDIFQSPFTNDYFNLLPNITLSKKTGEFNLIKVSYNQRIQRPNQRHVNPFIDINDERDISFGNPSLNPERIHQVELGSTFFIGGSMINASLFGKRTTNVIENLLRISEEGISESTYYNFGSRSAIGVNLFGSITAGDITFRGGIDMNAWKAKGIFENEQLSNTGFDYNGRMNITWTISETLRAEFYSFYRSPISTVQGKIPTWSMMSFGIKKELLNRRLTIGLNITEPFRENFIQVRELEGSDFYQYSRNARPVRSFGINAGFRFGKIDFKERNRKKPMNEMRDDDQGDMPFNG